MKIRQQYLESGSGNPSAGNDNPPHTAEAYSQPFLLLQPLRVLRTGTTTMSMSMILMMMISRTASVTKGIGLKL